MRLVVKLIDDNKSRIKVGINSKKYFESDLFEFNKESSRFYYCTYNANVSETCNFIKGWIENKFYKYL